MSSQGITQTMCNSFLAELPQALHNFSAAGGNVFKMALFKGTASISGVFDATVTNYSQMGTNETSGTGYTAGGMTLVNVTPVLSGVVAVWSFANAVWPGATFTTRGALIYNSTNGNRAVAILDFGADKSPNGNTFTVTMPNDDASNAILRLGTQTTEPY